MRTEDGYIIYKCLNGEPEAFNLLVDKYKASIYAFTYAKLRNFHDAEDVTQETFIKAYQNLRTLRRWDSFLAWLYSIASDLCKKWVRSHLRRPDHDFAEDQDAAALKNQSMNSYRDDMMYESLHEALDSLPETYQQVLMLHYLGGMNSPEIARFLRASPTAIRKRLSRAREQLREEMIDMMDKTLKQHRLQASFTFRIAEAVKRIKIHPTSRTSGLPWGLSLAVGIILAVLSFSPSPGMLKPAGSATGSPLHSEMKVLRSGEIPVDILDISEVLAISSKHGDGSGGDGEFLSPQRASFMAPDGETTFSEVSAEVGISDEEHGYSAAFFDYDNDGDLDIYVSNWGWHGWDKPNKLYRNNGDGTFTDVAEDAGVRSERSGTANTIFGDYDNDGDEDLYLVNGAGGKPDKLYRNEGDGTFTDVTRDAGLGDARDGKIGLFWDYDNDGHLDIYETTWGKGSILYRNNGDGTFTDFSRKVGSVLPSGYHTAAAGDYDNDGDLDLFTPTPYRNNGDGTFTSALKDTKMAWDGGWSGTTLGDYNNDGHLDVCIIDDNSRARMYKNNGDGTFADVTQKAGIVTTNQLSRPVFIDYNNDGYLDLYIMDILLYQNNGDGTFTDVTEEAGIKPNAVGVWYIFGVGFGDCDNDGDIDLYMTRAGDYNAAVGPSDEFFRNEGNDNHWLHIKTVGTQSNRDGIGARVTVKAGNLSQIRDVVSEWSRSCPPVCFGMGEHRMANSVEIRWPSGQVTTLNDVPTDRMIQVTEGEPSYRILYTAQAVEPSDKLPGTWGMVKKTELFQNYPNPFNPETWIPYQLGRDSSVVIKIRTPSGKLVRTLELGDKTAGLYTDKTKAAYWDGNNDSGEAVASGVYFYTIQTEDDYTDTKKMVIAR